MDDYVGHLREFRRILRNLENQATHPLNRETIVALSRKLDRDESQLNADRLERSIRATVEATRTLDELGDYEQDVLAVFHEIVLRKRSELERERFRKLLDGSAESIFVVDPRDGRFVDVNETAVRALGYAREELLGLSLNHIEVALPVTPSAGWHEWVESVQSAETPYLEGVHRRKDGTRFSVEVSVGLLTVDNEKLLLLVARDVTERKRHEARLRRQWGFFSRLAQRSVDGIFAFDRRFHVTYWNPAMERLFGERKTKVLGKNAFELLPQLKELGEDRFLKDALAGTSSTSRNRPFTQPGSGREVYFDGHYSPLTEESGEVLGGIAILRDVTERRETQVRQARETMARIDEQRVAQRDVERRLESELAALKRENETLRHDREETAEKREEVVRTERVEGLETLARGLAREVEPLMAGILSQTGVALAELPVTSPLRRGVEEIEEAALSANDLASTLYAFCGNGRADVHRVELAELVRELEHSLRGLVGDTASLVLPEPPDPGDGSVRGDDRQLQQAVVALVSNASEALADSGGEVTVTTGIEDVDAERLGRAYLGKDKLPGSYAFLSVADTGEGMDEETQSKIFVPFFTTKAGHRGLGLATVLGILRAHAGILEVSSVPGEGTVMKALFPLATPRGA